MSYAFKLETMTVRFQTVPASCVIAIHFNDVRAACFDANGKTHTWRVFAPDKQVIQADERDVLRVWLAQCGLKQPESALELENQCVTYFVQRHNYFAALQNRPAITDYRTVS